MTTLHTRPARLLLAIAAIAAFCLALFPRLQAQAATNLAANGTFDTDLANWVIGWAPTGTMAWDSGHVVVTATEDTDQGSWAGAQQCLNGIVAGQAYQLEDDVLMPEEQVRAGHAQGSVSYFTGLGCTKGNAGGQTTPQCPCKDGIWHHQTEMMVAPPGAVSVLIAVGVNKLTTLNGFPGQPSDNITAWFDNVTFVAVGDAPPPAPSPTVTSTPTIPPTTPPATTPPPTNTPPTTPPPTTPPATTPPPTNTPPTTPPPTTPPPTNTPTPPHKTPTPRTTPPPTTPPWYPPIETPPATSTPPPPATSTPSPAKTPVKTATPGTPVPPLPETQHDDPAPSVPPASAATPLPPQTGSGQATGGHGTGFAFTAIGLLCLGVLGMSFSSRSRR